MLIDLTAFSSDRATDPRYRLLGKLVRNAYSMTSIRIDLHHALRMMRILSERQADLRKAGASREGVPEDQALNASSLFVTALLLYTRSVLTQGRDRSTLGLEGRLEPRLRAHHDRIVELRNRHFAHYASADLWEECRVVLVLTETRMAISYPNDRRFVRADDAQALHALLEGVQPLVEAAFEKASGRLNLEINRLIEEDEDFPTLASDFHFDPEGFFREQELPGFYASLEEEEAFWHAPQFGAKVRDSGDE